MDKRGARKSQILSFILTLFVVGMLLISGPVNAVVVDVTQTGDSVYKASDGTITFTASVNIETGEQIPIANFSFFIYANSSTYVDGCTFNPNCGDATCRFGSSCCNYTSCKNIVNISFINRVNWTTGQVGSASPMFGYGYGYNSADWAAGTRPLGNSSNATFFNSTHQTQYGYNYAYDTGTTSDQRSNEIKVNITWNMTKAGFTDGNYTVDFLAHAVGGTGADAGEFTYAIGNKYSFPTDLTRTDKRPQFTLDTTAPAMTVTVSPTDGDPLVTAFTISCSATDRSPNGNTVDSNPSASCTVLTPQSITKTCSSFSSADTGPSGIYTITCQGTDKAGNSATATKTFTVRAAASQGTSAGAGGAATTPTEAAPTVDLDTVTTWEETDKAEVEVKYNDIIALDLPVESTKSTESHSVKIKQVDEAHQTVTIEISSTPFTVILEKSIIQIIDINKDGINDLSATLIAIVSGNANIKFEKLESWKQAEEAIKEEAKEEVPPTGEVISPPEEEEKPTEVEVGKFPWWIVIILVVIAALGGVYAYLRKHPITVE